MRCRSQYLNVLNRLHNGDAEVMPGFYLPKADAKFDEIDRAIVNEFSSVFAAAPPC